MTINHENSRKDVIKMYRNLEAEMARAKITQAYLAKQLGITPTTLSLKLNGKSNLSLKECVQIKKILDTEETVDYLFAEDERGWKQKWNC